MSVHPTEYRYQKEIIKYLSTHEFNGLKYTYLKDGKYEYDRFKCIIPSETLKFIENTQRDTYNDIIKYTDDSEKFISKLVNDSVKRNGLIKTLKDGVEDFNVGHIDLIYFNPDREISKSYLEKYQENRFVVVDEFKYSVKNENRICYY